MSYISFMECYILYIRFIYLIIILQLKHFELYYTNLKKDNLRYERRELIGYCNNGRNKSN